MYIKPPGMAAAEEAAQRKGGQAGAGRQPTEASQQAQQQQQQQQGGDVPKRNTRPKEQWERGQGVPYMLSRFPLPPFPPPPSIFFIDNSFRVVVLAMQVPFQAG